MRHMVARSTSAGTWLAEGVSSVGKGRVVMFADNPNFRGTAYGTNRMFLNAIFLGNHIAVPKLDSPSNPLWS